MKENIQNELIFNQEQIEKIIETSLDYKIFGSADSSAHLGISSLIYLYYWGLVVFGKLES